MKLNPYLNFRGSCREAFDAYAQILGGRIAEVMTFAGTPAEAHVPAEWRDKVMHAMLELGDGVLMGSDAPPNMCPAGDVAGGGAAVALHPASVAEGRRIFDALAEGGQITMPFGATFWSAGFGQLIDRWGTSWMVNVDIAPATGAETGDSAGGAVPADARAAARAG